MEDKDSENVLTEIEENFQDLENNEDDEKLNEDELLEEFDVVDSWEVGGADDLHGADASKKSDRRSRGSSYSRRRNDRPSRRDFSYDRYRSHKSSYKRPRSRSNSKPNDHHRSSKRLSDEKTSRKPSVERVKESTPGSSKKVDKLPDLKCTTSIETGEVNVVLLSEDKNALVAHEEKEALQDDDSNKKHPLLLKNPFALARLRRKQSQSPARSRVIDSAQSPRRKAEKYRRDSRVVGSRDSDRSLSPYRPRSKHRTSPSFYDKKSNRRFTSLSPERDEGHRASDRRNREGGRWHGRSRERSVLSRVSSKSPLSFISSDEMSPRDHERKRSPLRPKYAMRPKVKTHSHIMNSENFMSSTEDFDHKLALLLKEGKQKQCFTGDSSACTPSEYPVSTWRQAEWTNPNTPQVSNNNYSCDTSVKPDYNTNVHHNVYPGYNQDQYNQANYYSNSQTPNYVTGYGGDTTNPVQPPYSYGNQYPNQIPNQFFPPMAAAPVSAQTSYANPPEMVQFQPIEPLQSHTVPAEIIAPPMVNTSHQSYTIGDGHMNYSGIPPPQMPVQESMQPKSTQDQRNNDVPDWNKYNRKRIPTRTNIPLTSEENITKEDSMRTPSPPLISCTWREIESGGKKLSSLLEEANKKRDVIARCEEMLQKMLSNDPLMERFKITQCENMHHFSVKEVPNPASGSKAKSKFAAVQLAAKKKLQSPLLRKETNPHLKYVPWLPGDEDISDVAEHNSFENPDQASVQGSSFDSSNPVKEEVCARCITKRDGMVSISTQTEKAATVEMGVQVEDDWNHYYPDSTYKNRNSSYSAWYK